MTPSNEYRLPLGVIPTHYQLTLTPDLNEFTFTGEAAISIELKEPTSRITLNAAELSFTEGSAQQDGISLITAQEILVNEESERATIIFDKELGKGRAKLFLKYLNHF